MIVHNRSYNQKVNVAPVSRAEDDWAFSGGEQGLQLLDLVLIDDDFLVAIGKEGVP